MLFFSRGFSSLFSISNFRLCANLTSHAHWLLALGSRLLRAKFHGQGLWRCRTSAIDSGLKFCARYWLWCVPDREQVRSAKVEFSSRFAFSVLSSCQLTVNSNIALCFLALSSGLELWVSLHRSMSFVPVFPHNDEHRIQELPFQGTCTC